MPGLFGFTVIDRDLVVAPDEANQYLNKMIAKLAHHKFYHLDTWADPQGKYAVGRIGHQHLIPPPDGPEGIPGTDSQTWVYGTWIEGQPITDPFDALAQGRGSFSGICRFGKSETFCLVSDRRASEPVFYTVSGGILFFAPEVKALLSLGLDPGGIDQSALASFLTTGYLFPHQSLHDKIKKIPGSHRLIIREGKIQLEEYFKYIPGSRPQENNTETLAKHLGHLVQTSVIANTECLDQTVTFLSGGLDSRYILSCLEEEHGGPPATLHAVTWGKAGGGVGTDEDIAQKVAHHFEGINHRFIPRKSDQFKTWFREVNYILDGLSEIPAFHPYEYEIMKSIRSQGFTRVLRGDEAFGYLGRRYSADSALATIGIRPFNAVENLKTLVHRDWYTKLAEVSLSDFHALKSRFTGIDPTTLKDVIYFSQRVPTYLSQASYYKQTILDQRNPLLADDLLDFYLSVPNEMRRNKKLFFRAFELAFPKLSRIPYASKGGLEDWGAILSQDTPLHHYFCEELGDSESGIWEIFDRGQAQAMFQSLGQSGGDLAPHPMAKMARGLARNLVDKVNPKRIDNLMMKRSQRRLPKTTLLMRLLVLKDWHDRFYTGRRK